MLKDFGLQILRLTIEKVKSIWSSLVGKIALISSIVYLFQLLGVWESLLGWFNSQIKIVWDMLTYSFLEIPLYFWLLFVGMTIWMMWQWAYLRLVSGVYVDNFDEGLHKWEYRGSIYVL